MPSATRYQGFIFTHNNYTQEDWDKYVTDFNKGKIRYLIMGRETAPTTGTKHIQGFMWTPAMQTLANMKKKYNGAWVALPGAEKGPEYWVTYCSKEDADSLCLGIRPSDEEFRAQSPKGVGARSDLLELKKKIDEGVSAESLMDHDQHFVTLLHHKKAFIEYQSYKRKRTQYTKPNVVVYYGETGVNKTRRVHDYVQEHGGYDEWWSWAPHLGQWFDGYAGQNIVLFDEFRGQLPYGMMLSLLDGYPGTRVQIKGGMVYWSPTDIFITSPVHPREWYPNLAADDRIDQLLRRIDSIQHIQKVLPGSVSYDPTTQFPCHNFF